MTGGTGAGTVLPVQGKRKGKTPALWDEVFGPDGQPRELYRPLLDRVLAMPAGEKRLIVERLEATMREMGVTFNIDRDKPWGRRPWFCDALPELFGQAEWERLADGLRQRLRAFEAFLQDIHGPKEILRQHVIPAQPVLGSPYFQRPAVGLPRPGGAFLHLCGAALTRLADGRMAVAHHYFSNASGISYMMQNRRALSRVFAEAFHDHNPQSIADVPVAILETFRTLAPPGADEPVVALLTGGAGSPAYSEHAFLARRMGIPLVQGGDLLVLDDRLYLKSVSGLERIDVLYARVADAWLDSMVFRRDSLLGVSGLVQCVRSGNLSVVNSIGSRLADDRALLPFTSRIVNFYLNEPELLPTVRTWWLGDLDQRDHVLDRLDEFDIRPLYGEPLAHHAASSAEDVKRLRQLLEREPQNHVAQPRNAGALTACLDPRGALDERRQDHIAFALRGADGGYDVFPGALTRVSLEDSIFTASELGGGSKDTWVLSDGDPAPVRAQMPVRIPESRAPQSYVTSRVADSFYWLGRYLERAQSLAYMVGVVESLETEELNRAEQQLYRPVWNRMLPPLEKSESGRKRSITTALDRYHLTLDVREEGSLINTLQRAVWNARQIQECLSVEACGVLNNLEAKFGRAKFRPERDETLLTMATQRLCGVATAGIAEFFGTAEATMLADRGWNFCRAGQYLERAAITCNAGCTIFKAVGRRLGVAGPAEHAIEIELSAFLRMLGSRDAYRRLYQMRAEPVPVLEMLYGSEDMPRSVRRCLSECRRLLDAGGEDAEGTVRTREALGEVIRMVESHEWVSYLAPHTSEREAGTVLLDAGRMPALVEFLTDVMRRTLAIHETLTDGFINHQVLLD